MAADNLDSIYLKGISKSISEVHIDIKVLLKIMKHCRNSLPQTISGSLMGFDQKGVVEVTYAFAVPSATTEDAITEENVEEYQNSMIRLLTGVNVDPLLVGWYQSVIFSSFSLEDLQEVIDNQLAFQKNLSNNTIVLLYDPTKCPQGEIALKALQVSPNYLKNQTKESETPLTRSDIFTEVPVKIKASGLNMALMFDLKNEVETIEFGQLDLSIDSFLERHLRATCDWVDELTTYQSKFQQYNWYLARQKQDRSKPHKKDELKSKEEDKSMEPPAKIESLLVMNQIDDYCQQIQQFAAQSFQKLFLAGNVRDETNFS